MSSEGKILFVDDEPKILEGIRRQFYKRFVLDTAVGPQQGLAFIASRGPYAVIVTDLRMPKMTGIEFLAEAKNLSPQSVRIMLTGHADIAAAIGAINQGNIFRFLNKPCAGEVLGKTIDAALEQHRMITAEHVLLEKTLRGAVEVLTEMLSLSSPEVFSQTARLRETVRLIAESLKCTDSWKFEIAAMLSLIGCITVPPAIVTKVAAAQPLTEAEHRIYNAHPQAGHDLLAKIPRLEEVARMILRQAEVCDNPAEPIKSDDVLLGARMLKIALDFDHLQMTGVPGIEAAELMRARGQYNPRILDALASLNLNQADKEYRDMTVTELVPGMTIGQDVIARNGLLLLARGQEITPPVIARLEGFRATQGLVALIRVVVDKPAS